MSQISTQKRTTYLNERVVPRPYGKEVLIYNWEAERGAITNGSNGILPGLTRLDKCDVHVSETKASFTPSIFQGISIKKKYIETFFEKYHNKQIGLTAQLQLIDSREIFQNNFTTTNTILYDIEPKRWLAEYKAAACNSKPKHIRNLDMAKDYGSQTHTGAREQNKEIDTAKLMGGCMETTYQSFHGGVSADKSSKAKFDGNMLSADVYDGAIKYDLTC